MSFKTFHIRSIFLILFLLVLAFPFSSQAISLSLTGKPEGFAKIIEDASSSVVNIYTTKSLRSKNASDHQSESYQEAYKGFLQQRENLNRQSEGQNALGSGFIISEDGKVLTAYHTIAGADDVHAVLQDGTRVLTKVVGVDKRLDLAVLKLTANRKYEPLQFADSDKARVGDWVLAIGNPFGLQQTVTAGIISAKGRVLGAGPWDDFIQTDASINPGNSGGPLLNMDGEVLGMASAMIGLGQGLGFAIPAKVIKSVMNELIQNGRVTRGWLGVTVRDLQPEEKEAFALKKAVLVMEVAPEGPAGESGILPGDLILRFEGKKVSDKRALPYAIALRKPGSKVVLTILRAGKELEKQVTLGDLDNPNKAFAFPLNTLPTSKMVLGIDVRDIETDDKLDDKGVVVTKVHKNSSADVMGMKDGDVITRFNDSKISSLKDFRKRFAKVKGGELMVLEVKRKGQLYKFALKK